MGERENVGVWLVLRTGHTPLFSQEKIVNEAESRHHDAMKLTEAKA